MTMLEPGHEPETIEEEVVATVTPAAEGAFIRPTCKNCRRPVMQLDSGRLVHVVGDIDQPLNKGFCLAELFVEEQVRWGWLTAPGKHGYQVGKEKIRA